MRLKRFLKEEKELPSFVTYDSKIKADAQYFSIDDIRVGDKFFTYSKDMQYFILVHEIGHAFSDILLKNGKAWEWLDKGYYNGDFNGRTVFGLNGHTIPGEIISEAVYHTEPSFLKKHYKDLYDVLGKEIKKFNKKLPNEIQKFLK